jgi:hypothetical protein
MSSSTRSPNPEIESHEAHDAEYSHEDRSDDATD